MDDHPDLTSEQTAGASLDKEASRLLDECRMVLPGIQALFGFQLIAVFNQRFASALSTEEQQLHLAAIILVVLAIALVMAPAALQRQAEKRITTRFITAASRLLMWSMAPLAIGICLDLYLVSRIVLNSAAKAGIIATALFGAFVALWVLLPRSDTLRDLMGRE